MGIHTSRTADPLPDAPSGATMGTWGLWLTIVVLAMFVAGMAAAALYLHTGQPAWPPEGIDAPPRTRATLASVLVLIGAIVATIALRSMRAGERQRSGLMLAVSLALVSATVVVLAQDLRLAGFHWGEHAYASVYWILTGTSITFTGVGAFVIGAVAIQMLVGLIDEERHLELTNATIYVWFAGATTVVLLALVHLLPAATRGPG